MTINIAYVVPIITFSIGVLVGMFAAFALVVANRRDK